MDRRAGLLFVALGFAWGIPYLLIKVSVEEVSPAFLVLARTALAVLLLLPIAHARGQLVPVLRRWRVLLAYAIIEVAIPWILLGNAEQHLPSSTTGLLIAAVPLAGVVVALVSGSGERLGTAGWVGLVAGLAGVAALVGFDIDTSDLGSVLEVFVVVAGYAIGPAILARYLSDEPGIAVVAVSLSIVAVVYLPLVVLGGGLPAAVPSTKVIASIVVLAVVCTAGAFVMLFSLVGLIGAVRATAITYVNPAVAIVAGAVFLGEQITVWTVVGFGLVLVGSYLLTRRASPRDEVRERVPGDGAVVAIAEPLVPAGRVRST
ncbi:MAG: DMT family transporter [Patulibacter sp.]|nr:DMT family transporter [Patulibacter sp.]